MAGSGIPSSSSLLFKRWIYTVKEALFPDFKGIVKSLGAWGGDFVLVISNDNPKAYFNSKGYEIIIPYSKMIL